MAAVHDISRITVVRIDGQASPLTSSIAQECHDDA
jgi:hypothetical protein